MSKDNTIFNDVLFLLPFYIMRYEKEAEKIEVNDEKLAALLVEYEDIQQRLIKKLGDGEHGREYAELVDLITRISDYIFRDKEKTKKGVSGKMRGKVLELEVDKIIDEGIAKGIERELPKAVEKEVAKTKLETQVGTLYSVAGYTPEVIAEKINITIEEVIRILKKLKLLSEQEKLPIL